MQEFKHFIRVVDGIVVLGFTEGFPEIATYQEGDLLLTGYSQRQFQFNIFTDDLRGQYKYKVVNGAMVERTQEELDLEWTARPAPPKTAEQNKIALLESQIAQQSAANTEFMEFVLSTLGV